MIQRKTKLKILFGLQLIIGISLCIGGIWVPPLFVVGGIFIGGALGMFQSSFNTSDFTRDAPSEPQQRMAESQPNVEVNNAPTPPNSPVCREEHHTQNMFFQFNLNGINRERSLSEDSPTNKGKLTLV